VSTSIGWRGTFTVGPRARISREIGFVARQVERVASKRGQMAKSIFGVFRAATQDEPLKSVTATKRWFANLPANDPLGGAEAALAVLLEEAYAKHPPVTADAILALLELDRLSLPLQAQLQSQNRSPRLSAEVREKVFNAHSNLVRWLAYAYEQIYEGSNSQPTTGQFREHLHGVFSRLFHYQGVYAQHELLRYEQWIPARWEFLHAAYKAASEQRVATLPFSLVPNPQPGERFSAEQEYLQLLLRRRINTGNLTIPQIELLSEWLRAMVPSLTLAATPPSGDGYWILDLAKTEGLCAARREVPAGDVLYLDIAPLRTQLNALMERMTEHLAQGGDGGDRIETKERLTLAKRLERLLLPHSMLQPRRGERSADQRPILVASGWTEIPILMRQSRPWITYQPFKYTYDSTVGPGALNGAKWRNTASPDGNDRLHLDRRGWQILDTSESGYRIQSRTRAGAQLPVGALLALLLEGESRWRIGIVRRLKRRTGGHTELGVEIIAENAKLMTLEPVEADVSVILRSTNARTFQAIYVPPQQRAQMAPIRCLVLPTAEFKPGRLLSLKAEGQTNEVRLALLIEYTKEWVWTTCEVVGKWRESVRL
jgi:hypothetical protein